MKIALISLLAMTAIGATAQSGDVSKVGPVAGTYELIICKSACSFSEPGNVFAKAVIVLLDHVMAQKDVEQINPSAYFGDQPVRACFAVKRNFEAQSYAGIDETGVTAWLISGHTLEFTLFRSPDAGYSVEVERNGDLLAGTGRSWGVGMGAPPPEYSPDLVVGRRRGPPDISVCRPDK